MKSTLLMIMIVTVVGCGQKKSSKSVNQIFVKGNPLTMVKDTDQNKTSFINTDNKDSFNGFALGSLYIFTQKAFLTQQESEDIEEGNEATEDNRTEVERPTYSFRTNGFNRYTLQDQNGKIGLDFENTNSTLNLKKLILSGSSFPVKVEHYSISQDKTKMSFMVTTKTRDEGIVLLVLSFYKVSATPVKASVIDSMYKYIFGPGVKIPWKQEAGKSLDVVICPNISKERSIYSVTSDIKVWERSLARSGIDFKLNVIEKKSCKPFSDVEEHSINYISSYLTIARTDQANPAFTVVQPDYSTSEIFDADIIFLGAEIKKHYSLSTDSAWAHTMTHEFGHFMGLDHQFSGIPSIMSYETEPGLTNYDNNAIAELYKK